MDSRASRRTVEGSNASPSVHVDVDVEDEDVEDQDLEDIRVLQEFEDEEEQLRSREVSQSQTRTRSRITQKKKTTKQAPKKRKESEPRSVHWANYTQQWVEEGDPPIRKKKGKCNTCGVLIAADGYIDGTNGLKAHTATHEAKNNPKDGQTQTTLKFTASVGGTGASSLTTWKFDQKAIRLALCEMIIIDELPFRFVERQGFRTFMEHVCPQLKIPSRVTIRADCVKLFLEHKMNLKSFFQRKGFGRISITTDYWTAVNNTNFICVTAHCISKDWKLHKKIISFSRIVSHKANDVGAAIVSSLREWGLANILCCTVDNASANDGAIRCVKSYLDTSNSDVLNGKYLHMRCAAHILNLIVQDGLEEIGLSVRRVREAVKWVKASPARLAEFEESVNYLHIDCQKSLCLDVPTRWNSTYLMLVSAQPYEEVFNFFLDMKKHYVEDLNNKKYKDEVIGCHVEEDWINVKKMIEYLKKFYELTLLVSRTRYATSHLVFVEMCDVFDLINVMGRNVDYELRTMANRMREKLGKYWLEEKELNPRMNKLLYIAGVLDPRQKMKHVETCLRAVYEPQRATMMIREVMDSLTELFEFYCRFQNGDSSQCPRRAGSSTAVPSHGRSDRRGSLSLVALQTTDDNHDESNTSELTVYLAEKLHRVPPEECDQFDILSWWSDISGRFPVLSEMARDVLAVPISSVASEAAFSTGGRVLSPFRSSLTPNMVEALLCAEDWLKTSSVEINDEEGVPDEELEEEFATGNNLLILLTL